MPKNRRNRAKQIRRPRHGDLRVAPDDDRVAVVPRVAPSPTGRFPQDHEGGDFVEGVVHPVGLERGAVSGFVPAGVGGRGVEDAVDHEREDGPPGAPEHETADAGADNQREPKERVADGGAVSALEQLRISCLGTGEAYHVASARPFNGPRRVFANQAIVTKSDVVHGEDRGRRCRGHG